MLAVNLLWESLQRLPSQMRKGRETFVWNVFRKRHNDKTRFLPPSLPLPQLSRQGVVCAACHWWAESNSSASLQMVSSPGTSAGSWSMPASSQGEGRKAERLGESSLWETEDSVSCCCCTSLPFLHTAEKGKSSDAIPKDCEISWALKLKWAFRQLLSCLPQSKEVLWWGSSKPRCSVCFSFPKTFVLSDSPGSNCNSTWLWESKEFHSSEYWPVRSRKVVAMLPAYGLGTAWWGRHFPSMLAWYWGKVYLLFSPTSKTGSQEVD